jgi:hypothetical protein
VRGFCLFGKISDFARFAESAARSEMNYPIFKTAVHHFGEFGQRDFIAVQMNLSGRTVKGEIQNPVIAFTQKMQIIFEFFARIAGQMAEFRVLRFGNEFEHRYDVEPVFRASRPERFKTGDISFSRRHF